MPRGKELGSQITSPKIPYTELLREHQLSRMERIVGGVAQNARELFATLPAELGVDRAIDVIAEQRALVSKVADRVGQIALALEVGLDHPHIVFESGRCFYEVMAKAAEDTHLEANVEQAQAMGAQLLTRAVRRMETTLYNYGRVNNLTSPFLEERKLRPHFSPRNEELLRYVAEGLSNKEIARRLESTVPAIKNRLTEIFIILDIENRTQATAKAIELGIY